MHNELNSGALQSTSSVDRYRVELVAAAICTLLVGAVALLGVGRPVTGAELGPDPSAETSGLAATDSEREPVIQPRRTVEQLSLDGPVMEVAEFAADSTWDGPSEPSAPVMTADGGVGGPGRDGHCVDGAMLSYTVQSGDTLWRIAAELLGDGRRHGEIFEVNREVIGDSNHLRAGMVLELP